MCVEVLVRMSFHVSISFLEFSSDGRVVRRIKTLKTWICTRSLIKYLMFSNQIVRPNDRKCAQPIRHLSQADSI
jgi:hypothetical protein